jgi:predicted nucleic acid-binding protein
MSTSLADRRVLVDTSASFAAANRNDANHLAAAARFERLVIERRRLVTTNFVLAEAHALVLTRLGWHAAIDLLTEIRASQTIVRVRER